MGSKHKQAQSVRREAREALKQHRVALHERLQQFNTILKPKPKWCPKRLWTFGAKIFIDIEKVQKYFQ